MATYADGMRDRVNLCPPTRDRDSDGAPVVVFSEENWVERYAAVEKLSGRALTLAQASFADAAYTVTVRDECDLAVDWRIVWDEHMFEVVDVVPGDGVLVATVREFNG